MVSFMTGKPCLDWLPGDRSKIDVKAAFFHSGLTKNRMTGMDLDRTEGINPTLQKPSSE